MHLEIGMVSNLKWVGTSDGIGDWIVDVIRDWIGHGIGVWIIYRIVNRMSQKMKVIVYSSRLASGVRNSDSIGMGLEFGWDLG